MNLCLVVCVCDFFVLLSVAFVVVCGVCVICVVGCLFPFFMSALCVLACARFLLHLVLVYACAF